MSSEERLKILKMVADGILTIAEADELLEALGEKQPSTEPSSSATPSMPGKNGKGKWLRVIVTDTVTGKTKVNLRVPSGLISAGMKIGSKYSPELHGIDTGEILAAMDENIVGKFIDVIDEEEGEHVEIMIE
jgi:hypothetical protein